LKKEILYILCFVFGLSLGILLCLIFKDELSPLFRYTPKPDFLSDIAAFEALVIAIAIPLSFEMISRTSDRYNSDIIISNFLKRCKIKVIPIIIIILIIITIITRFLVNDSPLSLLWKIFAWIALIGFIVIAVLFLIFTSIFYKYLTNIELVLDELFEDAEKLLER